MEVDVLVRSQKTEVSSFNFERFEYLQNTFVGLVNLKQNNIIKIFTVVTLIFMPPTLIASIYGMNFHFMPELNLGLGYPMAMMGVVITADITVFQKKKMVINICV